MASSFDALIRYASLKLGRPPGSTGRGAFIDSFLTAVDQFYEQLEDSRPTGG